MGIRPSRIVRRKLGPLHQRKRPIMCVQGYAGIPAGTVFSVKEIIKTGIDWFLIKKAGRPVYLPAAFTADSFQPSRTSAFVKGFAKAASDDDEAIDNYFKSKHGEG